MKFANVSSDAELTSLVRTQSETYADKLKTLASQFTDEVKANSDKFDGFFKTLADSITETANDLKTRNPELASFQVKCHSQEWRHEIYNFFFTQDTIEKSIKSVLQESEKLRSRVKEDGEGISENAEKILKKVYEDTLETAKTVSEQLANAAKKD